MAKIAKLITGTRVLAPAGVSGSGKAEIPAPAKKSAPAKGKMTPARSKAGYEGKY